MFVIANLQKVLNIAYIKQMKEVTWLVRHVGDDRK